MLDGENASNQQCLKENTRSSSAIIHGFEYFNLKMAFKPWHTTPKHLLVLLDATSLGDNNRSRRSIIWLQVGNLCDLQNNASVLWGVRYAKFWSIQYFIDVNILQNPLIDISQNILSDIDIFQNYVSNIKNYLIP